jgi:DNA mismatch repair ATPase MutS
MSKPLIAESEIILKHNIKTIWDIVVNNNDYKWRTGINKIEILENDKDWIEYYGNGKKFFTKFTLTEKEENKLYSFAMENKRFYGNWAGKFVEVNKNETKCEFTETIFIRNKLMEILARLFWDIKKAQKQYLDDLGKKLEESN